ncbi:fatty-acyl-CoA synthase [Streptomyces albus]|uniref:Fatty-acyl-CoA synthase n=1 Tax=Streptomyces albus (strain ATCC 21838 / DSM 41398 / FERM P-419 / JCM 4703 / NBRC 107858) TaxID=1081613 RepID=A0A0B5F0M1_STRA4|nr:fatty-acyl-CoA synthase [Streptomyces albus]AOU78152.1 fatty-acyl-CoA synthase [Streptomyces albus]AYN33907.1 fatty-acyl-CoA synthase [Streptomyces albus]
MSSLLLRAAEAGRALTLLHRARLFDPARPDRSLRFERDARRWGPLCASVRGAARRIPDSTGLIDDLGPLTYAELDRRSDSLAAAWRADGIGERAVIGVLCRDHRGLFDALLAAAKLGARLLLLNTGFAGPQLADVARREGVDILVYDEEFTAVADHLPADVERFLAWTEEGETGDRETQDHHSQARATEDRRSQHPHSRDSPSPDRKPHPPVTRIEALIADTAPEPPRAPSQVGAVVLLTSGTTGLPKGAPRQVKGVKLVVQLLDRVPWEPGGALLVCSPLFHGTGLAHAGLAVSLGSTLVVQRRFDARRAVAALAEHRCTGMVLVPTMLHRMLELGPEVLAGHDLSRLRIMLSAGAALPPALVERALDTFGEVLYNLYGSTEVALATIAQPRELRAHPATAGRTLTGCEVRLYDAQGRPVREPGRPGRVFVGNGMKFGGYTDGQSKHEIDGLMSTGDTGHFDADGLLFLDGREDDMVVCGGENVFPAEIENLLWAHEDIAEAAVIGVEHPEFGTRLAAFVVLEPGRGLTEEQVRDHVRARLARHKVPAQVLFLDALPRNPTGKLLRRTTRALATGDGSGDGRGDAAGGGTGEVGKPGGMSGTGEEKARARDGG